MNHLKDLSVAITDQAKFQEAQEARIFPIVAKFVIIVHCSQFTVLALVGSVNLSLLNIDGFATEY